MSLNAEQLNKIADLFQSENTDFHTQGMSLVEMLIGSEQDFRRLLSVILRQDIAEDISIEVLEPLFSAIYNHSDDNPNMAVPKILAYWSLGVFAQWNDTIVQNTLHLNMSGIGLESVPESIRHFSRLESIDLSKNRLQGLPTWLTKLSSLSELNVRENPLKNLPDGLTTLSIDKKQAPVLLKRICELTTLRYLDILNFLPQRLPRSFQKLTQLQTLKLSRNVRSKRRSNMTSLQLLKLREQEKKQSVVLPYWLLDMSIQHIEVYIAGIPETWLESLGEYSKKFIDIMLNMDSQTLTSFSILEEVFPTIEMATWVLGEMALWNDHLLNRTNELDLSNTYMLDLPRSLTNLKNLIHLDLSGNYITTIPEWFIEFENLQILSLNDNPITQISEVLEEMNNLHELNLQNTPFPVNDQIWLEALLSNCDINF